jgi:hypothetical protein
VVGSSLNRRMARCVWALADEEMAEHMQATAEPDAQRWIFTILDSVSRSL